MSGRLDDAGADALTRYVRQQVADLDINPNTRALFLYVLDNAAALVEFGRDYAKQKSKGKVKPDELMLAFLKSRGESLADFGITIIDQQTLSDAWACFAFVMDLRDSMKYTAAGPFGVAVAVGLIINDISVFLLNFTPAQWAYYELFIRQSGVAAPPLELPERASPPVLAPRP